MLGRIQPAACPFSFDLSVCTRVDVCKARVHTYAHAYACTRTHVYMYTCTVHAHMCLCVRVPVCVHVCACALYIYLITHKLASFFTFLGGCIKKSLHDVLILPLDPQSRKYSLSGFEEMLTKPSGRRGW